MNPSHGFWSTAETPITLGISQMEKPQSVGVPQIVKTRGNSNCLEKHDVNYITTMTSQAAKISFLILIPVLTHHADGLISNSYTAVY